MEIRARSISGDDSASRMARTSSTPGSVSRMTLCGILCDLCLYVYVLEMRERRMRNGGIEMEMELGLYKRGGMDPNTSAKGKPPPLLHRILLLFYPPTSTSIRKYPCTRELTFERITVIQNTSYRQCQKTQHRPFSHISSITLRSRISPCSSSATNPLFLPHRYSTISLQPPFLGMSKSPNVKKSEPYGSSLALQAVQFKTRFGKREND